VSDFAEQLVNDPPSEADQPAPVAEVQPPEAEPSQPDRPRNPDGTFAPKAKDEPIETGVKKDAAPPQPAAQPQPEPPSGEEGKHVPLAALNALKAKLAETEAKLAGLTKPSPEQSQQPQPNPQTPSPATPTRPDFSFDPSQFEDDPQTLFDARIHKNKMDMSTLVAVQQFSEAEVNEAWAAFSQSAATDPRTSALSLSLRDHPHPMGEVVQWHRQQREVKQLTEAGGLEKLRESLRAQLMAELQAKTPAAAPAVGAPAAVPMPKPDLPTPPPSLAKGGAGAESAPETRTDNEVFEQIFNKSKRLSRKR
jgi:hypothetical protein